ncbi:MAG: HU family DNA-binding protein [Planctomycetota bacterium]
MNKGDLIEAVAAHLGESKAVASRALDAVLSSVQDGVREDDKVAIAGFGTFKKKHRKARAGINPVTKEPIDIPASTTIGFTPSQTLKDKFGEG